MSVKCIDVSSWQSGINFYQVKADGIGAAIIRSGYGRETSQKDSRFEEHYRGAKAAGLKIGSYWYSYAKSVEDAKREAQACLSCIKDKRFDLPIYYDMEEASQKALGKATLTAMAIAFCDAVKAAGYRAGVYANPDWYLGYLDYQMLRAKYSIWLAHWANTHTLACDIWQYTDSGKVSGISGRVDMNLIENERVIGGNAPGKTPVAVMMRMTAAEGYQNRAGQVKVLKRLLNSFGFKGADGKALVISETFDNNTTYAVKALQKKFDIEVDGIVGPDTWKFLLAADSAGTTL